MVFRPFGRRLPGAATHVGLKVWMWNLIRGKLTPLGFNKALLAPNFPEFSKINNLLPHDVIYLGYHVQDLINSCRAEATPPTIIFVGKTRLGWDSTDHFRNWRFPIPDEFHPLRKKIHWNGAGGWTGEDNFIRECISFDIKFIDFLWPQYVNVEPRLLFTCVFISLAVYLKNVRYIISSRCKRPHYLTLFKKTSRPCLSRFYIFARTGP
jgi:hypothetical protein